MTNNIRRGPAQLGKTEVKKIRLADLIIFIIGVACLAWFILPFIMRGILNIGNVTGIIFFNLVVFYSVKRELVHEFIHKIWGTQLGRTAVVIIGVLAGLAVVLALTATTCMIRSACKKPQQGATLVLLGCKVYGDRASLMLISRMDAAYAYLLENEAAVCVLSGGQGKGETISEAECMYRYLTEKGIAAERLYKEDKSTSTRENLLFSKQIIEEYKLDTRLAIVTNEFHEYRAMKIAKALGLTAGAVPAKSGYWLFPTFYVRELYGIVYEWVF